MRNVIYAKRLKAENIFSAPGEGGGGMGGGDGGRVALLGSYDSKLLMIAHTGRLRLKGVLFSSKK